ncbi:hypothetical protein [Streptomyces sp. NPDC003090]|uniref:hypothetical protein n=1 Tax=Streptomyces sp. NPDC003090 TaxID=3154274 RepID=UPI0037F844F2
MRAVLAGQEDQPTRELYAQALALMQDPGVTPEEKARVAVFRAVIQSIEAKERAAKEQAEAEMLEDVQREWEARRVHHARVGGVEGLVPVVRGALKKASREGRTTTWRELQKKTGERQLGRLTHQDKAELLVLVDSKTEPDTPLWSVPLVASGDDAALRLHRDVSHRLNRPVPDGDDDLLDQLATEQAQLQQH